ncbi:unnamed protein product [Ophioblennius macclurei]
MSDPWRSLLQVISTLLVLGGAAAMAEAECPARCSCPPTPPLCLPGVSWVSDHCGCCKVCARQFNQDCSATRPCDHIKGLRCHLGAGGNPHRGLCRAEAHGLPCAFNGRVYQHGEDFQPVCQHQCTCMNGVVGCMPLCPQQVPLPLRHCSRPRLARPEGGCCEEWLCDDDNRISEELHRPSPASAPGGHDHPNHIDALLLVRPPPAHPDTFREAESFPTSESFPELHCIPQTSEWTLCSTTCGMGLSTRVSNGNPDCQLVRETRLCEVRPCEPLLPPVVKGKKCQRTIRPREPISISFGSCSTAPRYRPRSCGSCTDGRCCTPSLSRTVRLRFHCPDGDTFYNVMWVQRCGCSWRCRLDAGASSPAVSLHNDIHTFRD